jgi:hypothetical protein
LALRLQRWRSQVVLRFPFRRRIPMLPIILRPLSVSASTLRPAIAIAITIIIIIAPTAITDRAATIDHSETG